MRLIVPVEIDGIIDSSDVTIGTDPFLDDLLASFAEPIEPDAPPGWFH